MNGKQARLIRRYARATHKDAAQIKTQWKRLPRTLANGTKFQGDPAEAKRSYSAEMRKVVAASDD